MKEYTVTDQTGRLDKVISELDTAISRSRAKSLIDDGRIRVNDEPAKPK